MVLRVLPEIKNTADGLPVVLEVEEDLAVPLCELGEVSETVFHSCEEEVKEDGELAGGVQEGDDLLGLGFGVQELEDLGLEHGLLGVQERGLVFGSEEGGGLGCGFELGDEGNLLEDESKDHVSIDHALLFNPRGPLPGVVDIGMVQGHHIDKLLSLRTAQPLPDLKDSQRDLFDTPHQTALHIRIRCYSDEDRHEDD